jgi:hypothetical protein
MVRRAIPKRHVQVVGHADPRHLPSHRPASPKLAPGCTRIPGSRHLATTPVPAPATTPLAAAYQRFGAAILDLGNAGAIDLALIAAAGSAAVETVSGLAAFPAIVGALRAAIFSAGVAATSLTGQPAALSPTAPISPAAAQAAGFPGTTVLPSLADLIQAQDPLDPAPVDPAPVDPAPVDPALVDSTLTATLIATLPVNQLATQPGSNHPASPLAEVLPAPTLDPVDVPEPASILLLTLAAAATLLGRKLSRACAPAPSP